MPSVLVQSRESFPVGKIISTITNNYIWLLLSPDLDDQLAHDNILDETPLGDTASLTGGTGHLPSLPFLTDPFLQAEPAEPVVALGSHRVDHRLQTYGASHQGSQGLHLVL